ncbi:MAG TPA: hypothetical protein ENK18_07590 [Deltaproteobacteria bacterium]|nr:hypothetical protein [Deltaproteobacteria bacterium]
MDSALRSLLEAMLDRAGAVALTHLHAAKAQLKADGTIVTEVDRVIEALLVEELTRAFPDDGIQAEEGSRIDPRSGGATWFIDPIDGTSAFVGGLAYWGPTVCRVCDGVLEVGAFHVPRLGERWYAARGAGAWRDRVRLGAGPTEISRRSILFAPSRFHRVGVAPWPGKVRALGSSAAHLALVAAGGGLVAVIPRWHLWDVGCGALLIRETGGVIWDPSGVGLDPERCTPGLPFLAGSPNALGMLTDGGWASEVLTQG